MKLRLLPEAEWDLEIGTDFYESQREGLGAYFNDCLASDIESLKLYGGIMNNTVDSFDRFQSAFHLEFTINLPMTVSTFTPYSIAGKTLQRLTQY